MRYASVCSGVEAASLAWLPLGWECAWLSEIEPFPCAVLAARFPNTPNLGDMTKIHYDKEKELTYVDGATAVVPGRIDLLVGGTPCQSFSVAGKREGLDGASRLAKHFVRLLEEIQPKIFVWENVPGCLSSKTNGLYDFNFLLTAFAECGYSLAWRILDAQYVRVDGFPRAVPQRRRRVFVVGCSLTVGIDPAEILFEPDGLLGDTPPRRVRGKGFTADAESRIDTAKSIRMRAGKPGGGKGALIGDDLSHTLATGNDQTIVTLPKDAKWWDEDDVNPTLNQSSAASGTIGYSDQELFSRKGNGLVMAGNAYRMTAFGEYVNDGTSSSCKARDFKDATDLVCVAESGKRYWMQSNTSGTLRAEGEIKCPKCGEVVDQCRGEDGTVVAIALAENTIGRQPQNGGNGDGFSEELAYTQNATEVMGVCSKGNGDTFESDVQYSLSSTGGGQAGQGYSACRVGASVRRLLPVECERLMGFPDNWTGSPGKASRRRTAPTVRATRRVATVCASM